MTFIWLLVWLLCLTPALHEWNAWLIGLLVCIVLDAMRAERRL